MLEYLPLLSQPEALQLAVRDWRNQESVRRFMRNQQCISLEDHQRWLASLHNNPRSEVFVAFLREQPVAVISFYNIDRHNLTCEWAFYIPSEDLRGKGLGALLEDFIHRHIFEDLALEKINGEVLATNPQVLKLHQKFGYQVEGVRRGELVIDGNRVDIVLLGLFKSEWLAAKTKTEALLTRIQRML